MDHQDIRTLKILEEIDIRPVSSQRDLAKKLNISVGLVNSFVKRLVQKGYFKITTIPRNRVRYLLTPKGAAEKTRLTYEFIHYSYCFFKESRKRLQTLFEKLETKGLQKIVFFGVSDFAEIAYVSLQETNIQLVAIIDQEKMGEKFLGNVYVSDVSILNKLSYDKILITAIEPDSAHVDQLLSLGVSPNKILML